MVRRFVGYDRYAGPVAGQALAQSYSAVRLYVNFFHRRSSWPRRRATARGSRSATRRRRHRERLLAHETVCLQTRRELRERRERLDPVALLHTIREAQSALAAIGRAEPYSAIDRVSLEQFLSQLPE